MIKLNDLLNELAKSKSLSKKELDDFIKQGFRTTDTYINPETGTSVSNVEHLPSFLAIQRQIGEYADKFRRLKKSTNKDISTIATQLVRSLDNARELTAVLREMINIAKEKEV
jgi:hypothetical protein